MRGCAVRSFGCSADDFLELVMDITRYATIDDKLKGVDQVVRESRVTQFAFESRLPGLPLPGPRVVSRMELTPGERIDIAYADTPTNRSARRLTDFSASFEVHPQGTGIEVTRVVDLRLKGPLRLLEPALAGRWQRSVEAELEGVAGLLGVP